MGLLNQAFRGVRYGLARTASRVRAASVVRIEFEEVAHPPVGEVAPRQVHLDPGRSAVLQIRLSEPRHSRICLPEPPRVEEYLRWPVQLTGRIRYSEFRFFMPSVRDHFQPLPIPNLGEAVTEICSVDRDTVQTFDIAVFTIPFPGQYLCPFELTGPAVLDWSRAIGELPSISENLFRPLGKARSDGKNYRMRGLGQAKFGFAQRPEGEGYKKSYVEHKSRAGGVSRQVMTIWDLLFPLLQPPPIDLMRPQNVLLPGELLPHQPEGVRFLAEREGALLGDGVQTGKTIQAIVAMKLLFQTGSIKSALIVCPIPLLIHWQKQLEKWAPELWQGLTVVRSPNKEQRRIMWRMPAHVHATNFETIVSDFEEVSATREQNRFSLIVVDEIQRLKNRKNGFQELLALSKTAKYHWGLSATPLENQTEDVVSIFEFLKPGLLRRNKENELSVERKIKPYFLRRRTADVVKYFKEPRHDNYPVEMQDEQLEAYEAAFSESVAELRRMGERVTLTHALAKLQALKQLCNVHLASNQSAKADWLVGTLEEITANHDKALVFSQYVECGRDFLESRLQRFGCVNYGRATTDPQRRAAVNAFAEDPTKMVFVANPMTAGVGMPDLKEANYVIHFDHWWNPAIIDQANGRILGYGQKKEAFIVHLWVENSIEKRIQAILARKRGLFERVIDSQTSVGGTGLTEEELFEVFGLKPPPRQPSQAASARQGATSPQGAQRARWALEDLSRLSPVDFEDLTARLYKAMGFAAQRTKQSRDGGIDVIAIRDLPLGRDKLAIQCKHQSKPVGRPDLQNLLGVVTSDGSFSAGVMITTTTFSADATDFVQQNARLRLVDRNALLALLNEYCR